jgi:hypothetical protein
MRQYELAGILSQAVQLLCNRTHSSRSMAERETGLHGKRELRAGSAVACGTGLGGCAQRDAVRVIEESNRVQCKQGGGRRRGARRTGWSVRRRVLAGWCSRREHSAVAHATHALDRPSRQ